VDIQISKESAIPLRQQIAAQIELLIAAGKLKPGEALPSVRALARMLRIHHNTVSQAYQDVTALHLLTRARGRRLAVRTPDHGNASPPDLDDLINQTIRLARHHGYSLEELSARVRERLLEQPPDHILTLSFDEGHRRVLKWEIERALRYPVKTCSPEELAQNPERAMGALIASPPGVLAIVTAAVPKHRPVIPIVYCPAEAYVERVRKLAKPSIVALASVSEHLIEVARGLLGPAIGTRHTLIDCLLREGGVQRFPAADLLFCDVIVFDRLTRSGGRKNAVPYELISRQCLDQVAAMMKP
jgi:GntR family transcriptional regulator